MRSRWAIFVAFVAVLSLIPLGSALAADAEDVAAVVADTGVYVEPGSDASAARLSDLVASVRNAGESVSYVALTDEPSGGATTFADAVFRRLGEGVVVVVAPETVSWSGRTEVFTDVEMNAAIEASLDAATDEEVFELFTATLIGAAVPDAPAGGDTGTATQPATGSDSSGGSSLLIWLLLIGAGIVAFFWWRSRQNRVKGPRLDPRIAEVKTTVQEQIADVANDIIDMEDEVRVADNDQVDDFYEAAGRIYGDVTEDFPSANTPEALLALSNKLDEAIWQLDSAEALLDGKQPPPRPQPRTLPPPPAPAGTPQTTPQGPSSLPPRPSHPDYSRRPSRRSSPMGGGLMDILIGMAGTMMAGRARGGGGLLGGRSSRGSRIGVPQFPQVPGGRSGSPVPSPSRPGRSSSTGRSSSGRRGSARGGKTGRGRGGGRRRRG